MGFVILDTGKGNTNMGRGMKDVKEGESIGMFLKLSKKRKEEDQEKWRRRN